MKMSDDKIGSFAAFKPEQTLHQEYANLVITRSSERFVCVFMTEDFSESKLSIVVDNKRTLTCPVTLKAFKNGIRVPLGNSLHPNNGLNSYQIFFDSVRRAYNSEPTCDHLVDKIVNVLKNHSASESDCCHCQDREKRLRFLTHQLELLSKKEYQFQVNGGPYRCLRVSPVLL